VRVVKIFKRLGRQRDFHAEVGLTNGRYLWIERTMRIAVVNVLDVDTARAGTLLHHQRKQLHRGQRALANRGILLVLFVQALKFVLIREEGVVQARYIVRREQGDVPALDQALVHQTVDLHAVVQVADAVFLDAAIVLQNQQRFDFQVPQRVEQGGSSAPHPALGAGLDRSLEHFEERQAAGVLSLAATDLAAQGADTSPIDADTGTLRDIANNCASGGVDAIQTVAAFDQHAGAELAGGRTL